MSIRVTASAAIQVGALFLLLSTMACSYSRPIPEMATTVAPSAREGQVGISAALVVSPAFRSYAVPLGSRGKILVGDNLVSYASNVVQNAFATFRTYDSESSASGQADVLLIPSVVRSNEFIAEILDVVLVIEWTVKDRSGRKTVWLGTIEAKATESVPFFAVDPSPYENRMYQRVFQDLTEETIRRLQQSPEIRRIERSQRGEIAPATN
jgi:hypothetical protein